MEKSIVAVEAELSAAANVSAKPKEPRKTFLKRLNKAVNSKADADDSFWGSLSEEAQLWVNAGNDAVGLGGDIPDFEEPATVSQPDTVKTDSAPPQKNKNKVAPPAKNKKEAAAVEKTAPTNKVATKATKAARVGKFETIMRTALKHPKKSGADLVALLPDIAPASVVSVHGDLRRTVRLLHTMGLMEKNPF